MKHDRNRRMPLPAEPDERRFLTEELPERKECEPKEPAVRGLSKSLTRKDVQSKRAGYNLGTNELYRENVYFIRGYQSYRDAVESAVIEDHGYDRLSFREGPVSDPTFYSVSRLSALEEAENRIRIIEQAIREVPEKYRAGVWNHVVERVPLQDPQFDTASVRTWKRWAQRFVYEVARLRGLEEMIAAFRKC